ncbi:hypothetical protein V3C99_017159, partial [Haemonchus contortus]
PQRF